MFGGGRMELTSNIFSKLEYNFILTFYGGNIIWKKIDILYHLKLSKMVK